MTDEQWLQRTINEAHAEAGQEIESSADFWQREARYWMKLHDRLELVCVSLMAVIIMLGFSLTKVMR